MNRSAYASKNQPHDGQLWLAALGLSVLLNAGLLAIAGWMFLKADLQQLAVTLPAAPMVAQEAVSEIVPYQKAEAALGGRFDIRAFHDQVLGSGALPLPVLEAKIDRWIAASR